MTILAAVLALAALPASASTPASFLVFTATATYDWTVSSGGALSLKAVGPRLDPDEHRACAGRVYAVSPFGRKVTRLGPGFAPDRTFSFGALRESPSLLGCDGTRLYGWADNAVYAFDLELSTAARWPLTPETHDGIVPVLYPDRFLVHAGRAFVYASNAGEVHAVDLKDGSSRRLALVKGEDRLKSVWVDPDAGAFVALSERSRDGGAEGLEPGQSRTVHEDVARTYDLKDLSKAPKEAVVYEERLVRTPYPPGFWEDVERKRAHGMIIDFRPEELPEGSPRGTKFSAVTESVPAYAEVWVHDAESGTLGEQDFGVARADGRLEKVERGRDPGHGAVWFERGGKVWLTRSYGPTSFDVLPHAFVRLLERGAAGSWGDRVLAY